MRFSRFFLRALRQQIGLALSGTLTSRGGLHLGKTHAWFDLDTECGNINPLSIGYAFRPRLRFRLTLGGFTFPRKPWAYGEGDSHPLYRYSYRHSHYHWPLPLLTVWLVSPVVRSPTAHCCARSFGTTLSPNHYRCSSSRPVSYYALFKWWLLLSQHPGCLSDSTTLRTETESGTLAGGLGCSPFDHGYYHPQTDSRDRDRWYSEFDWDWYSFEPKSHSVLYPHRV